MFQAGSTIDQICLVISRHRATIYRWLAKIKRIGIRAFVKAKQTAKHRRSKARIPEYVIAKIVGIRQSFNWRGPKLKKNFRSTTTSL